MVCNILILLLMIFTATMGFKYINVTSLSYIHLPKKISLIFAGSSGKWTNDNLKKKKCIQMARNHLTV